MVCRSCSIFFHTAVLAWLRKSVAVALVVLAVEELFLNP
jgi:hypothetical protein